MAIFPRVVDNHGNQINDTMYVCKFANFLKYDTARAHLNEWPKKTPQPKYHLKYPQTALDARALASIADLEDLDALNLANISTRSS
jgi:hypothetical protein